jgi:hypothetical protein
VRLLTPATCADLDVVQTPFASMREPVTARNRRSVSEGGTFLATLCNQPHVGCKAHTAADLREYRADLNQDINGADGDILRSFELPWPSVCQNPRVVMGRGDGRAR